MCGFKCGEDEEKEGGEEELRRALKKLLRHKQCKEIFLTECNHGALFRIGFTWWDIVPSVVRDRNVLPSYILPLLFIPFWFFFL